MVYKVIGLMSGSSLDGLDIAYVHLQEKASTAKQGVKGWDFSIVHTACYPYSSEWKIRLASAADLFALDYQLLHTEYGHYLGEQVLRFVDEFSLHYQVQLIASHGHTALHLPARKMTAQLGDGAAIAAVTRINVVSDLRAMDLALGGQGAPIVPIGEKLLLPGYGLFLNLGGIANVTRGVTASDGGRMNGFRAFDVCPANRVLNELAALEGQVYDENGGLAAGGRVDEVLLGQLNGLPYYAMGYPKSLDNQFGTETVLPLIREAMEASGGRLTTADALRTYVEHIAGQVGKAVSELVGSGFAAGAESDAAGKGSETAGKGSDAAGKGNAAGLAGEVMGKGSETGLTDAGVSGALKMLVTGGGAHNAFLVSRLREKLGSVEVVVADKELADYKEALVMALIGVLRYREERNVLALVTGASRDSIGGAVWIGQEG